MSLDKEESKDFAYTSNSPDVYKQSGRGDSSSDVEPTDATAAIGLINPSAIQTKRNKAKRVLIYIAICIASLLIGIVIGFAIAKWAPSQAPMPEPTPPSVHIDPVVTVDTVEKILEPAGELVSGKYRYKNVMDFREAKQLDLKLKNKKITLPGTTDEYYIVYEGTIGAGYDLSKANLDVNNTDKTISIQMPTMKILSSTIDWENITVRAINDSVFNDTDVKASIEAQKKADAHMREVVNNDTEFKKITEDSAKKVLKALLTTSGDTKDYSVDIKFGGVEDE